MGAGGQVRAWRGWGLSQLGRGLGDALRDLGELEAGALHHAGLAAALVGTDHVAVAFAVQLVILCACGERAGARGGGVPSSPAQPRVSRASLASHCHHPTQAGLGPPSYLE